MTRRLTKNAAQCGRCKDVIVSTHVHDFVSCSCGAIFVDGGLAYQRYGYTTKDEFVDLSEWADEAEAWPVACEDLDGDLFTDELGVTYECSDMGSLGWCWVQEAAA